MKALKLPELNRFMGKLLKSETFDGFCLRDGLIRTFMEFAYSGEVLADFFDTDERSELPNEVYVPWKNVRENVFGVIKGKKTPLLMNLSFTAGNEIVSEYMKRAGGILRNGEKTALNLTFSYKNGEACLVTGFYRSTFSADKEPEKIWDQFVIEFLNNNDITYEEI